MKDNRQKRRTPDPAVDALEDALLKIGTRVNSARLSALRHPDQASNWRGADVVITSNFAWKPRSFVEEHDLVVRTHHAARLTWLFLEIRDAFSPWLDFGNKYGFYGSLAQAALNHLAARQPEAEDPRPLLRAVLDCAFQWLEVVRDLGGIPDNAPCLVHTQDAEGRQRRVDLRTGDETA